MLSRKFRWSKEGASPEPSPRDANDVHIGTIAASPAPPELYHQSLTPHQRLSLCDRTSDAPNVHWASVYTRALKRMNVVDGAPVRSDFISSLLSDHMRGEADVSALPLLLNSYELACVEKRWGQIASSGARTSLGAKMAVFIVPTRQHMRRRPPCWGGGAAALATGRSFARMRENYSFHSEIWIMLLLEDTASGQLLLWPVKRESELESDTDGRIRCLADFLAASEALASNQAPKPALYAAPHEPTCPRSQYLEADALLQSDLAPNGVNSVSVPRKPSLDAPVGVVTPGEICPVVPAAAPAPRELPDPSAHDAFGAAGGQAVKGPASKLGDRTPTPKRSAGDQHKSAGNSPKASPRANGAASLTKSRMMSPRVTPRVTPGLEVTGDERDGPVAVCQRLVQLGSGPDGQGCGVCVLPVDSTVEVSGDQG